MKRPCARTQLSAETGNQIRINLHAMKKGIQVFKVNAQRTLAGAYLEYMFVLTGADAFSDALRI
jgi:hypothetical protein